MLLEGGGEEGKVDRKASDRTLGFLTAAPPPRPGPSLLQPERFGVYFFLFCM